MQLLQKKNILKFNGIPLTVESVKVRVEMPLLKRERQRDSRLSEGSEATGHNATGFGSDSD